MTFVELCQKFREVVGVSGTGPATVSSQTGMNGKIVKWVADADEVIQRKWSDWDFLLSPNASLSFIAGSNTFTPAALGITDLARWVQGSFVTNPGTADFLRLKNSRLYDQFIKSDAFLGAAETGDIEEVVIRPNDNALVVYPTPATTTPAYGSYYKTPTRMTSDLNVSAIPARFHEAIIHRAKMFYSEFYQNAFLYESAKADFDEIMSRLEADQLSSMRGMWSSYDEGNVGMVVL